MIHHEPIHITIPGSVHDPRRPARELDGVVIHRVPELHPDDVTVIDGMRVTSISRTLIDCAEDVSPDELREMFANAHRRGLLDLDALCASRARVEWRPSLPIVDALIAEYADDPVA